MKTSLNTFAALACLLTFLASCEKNNQPLLNLLPGSHTGIDFINSIEESDSFNILTEEYIYNGGGVGVADFNNDGLQDLFFTGNMVSNKLYLNKGELRFEDVTGKANLNSTGTWSTGVAVADVNGDGLTDIYVCATMLPDASQRRNLLYINQGPDADGVPTFTEEAGAYGLDDTGYAMMAGFFDYDNDGDLDLYILINQRLTGVPTNYRKKMEDGSSPNNDKLYRNNGDNTFTDVSAESGINIEGFGLGLSIADFNNDGWQDLYISNDFLSNDILYINNQDGTFTNHSRKYIGHQSQFSMGNDAADVNNDGLLDIITLDMLPETNHRKKTTIGGASYQSYINNEEYGYEYQYVRNMLHINNDLGNGIGFSEIGQLSGIYQTEWSWSPLFADFDNDGHRDLVVTNGFPRDITDKDFAKYRASVSNLAGPGLLVDSIPVIRIANYAYRNNGDLTFTDLSKEWGFTQPCFSNGAAFADLDNDGDLDYVINNINDPAFVYENTLYTAANRPDTVHYLQVKLKGSKGNPAGLGAKVWIIQKGEAQYHDHNVYRGYLSSVDPVIHFGLGENATVDSLLIAWPGGKGEVLVNVKADQQIELSYEKAVTSVPGLSSNTAGPLVREVSRQRGLEFVHTEADKIDYNYQRTLPHKFSQSGPGLAVGDINGDGLEDLVVGGSALNPTIVFLQNRQGRFTKNDRAFPNEKKMHEDMGLLLFDADGDNDLDLYAVSGSIEYQESAPQYQDRLYLNDGRGRFTLAQGALPELTSSGSCVRASDFDGDGDLDLFVGGRVVPLKYPLPAESYLLRNDGGKFTNVTSSLCPELARVGMVTDALWSDVDNDGHIDLLVAGEFMSLTLFRNTGKEFVRAENTGLENYRGWWNSIAGADFDNDGDMDYVVGNYGLNNSYCATPEYPLEVYAKDFDNNGSIDAILACYLKESLENMEGKKLYPVHFWDELISQSPKYRQRFSSYSQYGSTSMEELMAEEDTSGMVKLNANFMESAYIENLGNFQFKVTSLPMVAQVAPVNGMLVEDINQDGNPDVLLIGNDFGNEVFVGKMDAFTGLVLLGDGAGNFQPVPSATSGFHVSGDAKALAKLVAADGNVLFVATQNKDSLRVFEQAQDNPSWFLPLATDAWAELAYQDGRKEKVELRYGAGYLSQSTRRLRIPNDVTQVTVYDSQGNSRILEED